MPYYRGDNYGRGDYYRGDLRKLLSRAAKGLVKAVVPGGNLIVAGFDAARGLRQGGPRPQLPVPRDNPFIPNVVERMFGRKSQSLECIPGAQGVRMNKSTYVTRGGGTSRWPQDLIVHEKGTECVRSRRMNVGNVRALQRGLRRAAGFAKIARRVLRVTSAYKGKGFIRRKRKTA